MKEIINKIDECVHCGLCLSDCPTYLTTGLESESPRGRLMIMKMMHQGIKDSPTISHLENCLDCRSCLTACPSGVKYDKIFDETQKFFLEGFSLKNKCLQIIISLITNKLFMNIINRVFWIFQNLGLIQILIKFPFKSFKNLEGLPKLNWNSFSKVSSKIYPAINKKKGVVAFFYGCVMSYLYPKVHLSTIQILQWNGYEVHILDKQVCCGALDHHIGNREKMSILRGKNQKIFKKYDTIIVNSAGCGAELKSYNEYTLSNKVKDITEFLCDIEFRIPKINSFKKKIYYDAPCHLIHGQQIADQPKILLNKSGFTISDNFDENLCCGAAGTYVLSNPNQSNEILQLKMESILKQSDIHSVVTANPGCQLQLKKGCSENNLNVPVKHICEIIHEQYMNDQEFINAF